MSFELDPAARHCRRFACIADSGQLGRGLTACVSCAHAKLLSGALEQVGGTINMYFYSVGCTDNTQVISVDIYPDL